MRIPDGFILRNVADKYIVVAVGERVKSFGGIVNLNESGAFFWKMLEKGARKEELLSAVLDEYDVDEETAKTDIEEFLEKLKNANLLIED